MRLGITLLRILYLPFSCSLLCFSVAKCLVLFPSLPLPTEALTLLKSSTSMSSWLPSPSNSSPPLITVKIICLAWCYHKIQDLFTQMNEKMMSIFNWFLFKQLPSSKQFQINLSSSPLVAQCTVIQFLQYQRHEKPQQQLKLTIQQ